MSVRQLGVEEEFLVFRVDAPRLLDAGPRVVATARSRDSEGQFEKELKAAQAELASQPGTSLGEIEAELRRRRDVLIAAATERGARIVAAGASPVDDRTSTTRNDRYHDMARTFGIVEERQLTCAMHVHVSVDSDDEGIRVLNGVAPWLPVLVALSANSPFHHGQDTGYASFRRIEWGQWPTAGATGRFADAAEYHRTVETLIATGAARDDGMIYFDARLSANYPTVEIRVCDVATDAGIAVALAALVRALVTSVAGGGTDEPLPRLEVLRAAHWRAARFGLSADLVHPHDPKRLAPAWTVVDDLVQVVAAALDQAGDTSRVTGMLEELREHGTGADRQRRAVQKAGGDVGAAVDVATVRHSSGAEKG